MRATAPGGSGSPCRSTPLTGCAAATSPSARASRISGEVNRVGAMAYSLRFVLAGYRRPPRFGLLMVSFSSSAWLADSIVCLPSVVHQNLASVGPTPRGRWDSQPAPMGNGNGTRTVALQKPAPKLRLTQALDGKAQARNQ